MIKGPDHGVIIVNEMCFMVFSIIKPGLVFMPLKVLYGVGGLCFLIGFVVAVIGSDEDLTELIFLLDGVEEVGFIGGFIHGGSCGLDDVLV